MCLVDCSTTADRLTENTHTRHVDGDKTVLSRFPVTEVMIRGELSAYITTQQQTRGLQEMETNQRRESH